jgi:acid phosphatase
MAANLERLFAIGIALVLIGGCAQTRVPQYRRNVALWASESAEFTAVALQTYSAARKKLDAGLADPAWTACFEQSDSYAALPPGIIVDLDETVLDNRPFQMRLIREGIEFDEEIWNAWVQGSRVDAIPGAVEFLRYAHERGVEVFYVTNRVHAVEPATRRNLALLGLPLNPEIDTVLTKYERPEWGSEKSNRREWIADSHRVLLIIGDNLGDFTSAKGSSRQERRASVFEHSAMWGEKWFMLPNPLYGAWVAPTLAGGDSSE